MGLGYWGTSMPSPGDLDDFVKGQDAAFLPDASTRTANQSLIMGWPRRLGMTAAISTSASPLAMPLATRSTGALPSDLANRR